MSLLLLFLLTAMGVSFLCSMLESVLMTTTLSYITMREEEGYKPAKLMKLYKTETERPLAAILSLNTIANTIGSAGVGSQVTELFGKEWLGVASGIVTFLILIFSEIIPKTLGTSYWKSLMGFCAYTIRVLIVLLYPIVWMVLKLTHLIRQNDADNTVSREEVLAMVNVGEEEGVIEQDENKIISNVMRLDSIKASDVMTPRVVAVTAPEGMTLREYYSDDRFDHFSRIPVYKANQPEFITGYVLRDDALEDLAEDHFKVTLGSIKRSLPSFDENLSISDIFDAMLKQKSQIALIIDEYGCFQGILTMEDIIETIFGLEIIDESDAVIDMQQYARDRWQQRQNKYKKVGVRAAAQENEVKNMDDEAEK